MIAKYNELAIAAGKPTRKGFDSKLKAAAAIAALQLTSNKGAKVKIAKAKREVKVHEAGPRGFIFGPVWVQSVRDGKGVALKPQNLPKLRLHAQKVGAEVTEDLSQAEIAALVAKAM